MTVPSAPIAIAGAGIGGLAAALALARRSVASHIFERRADATEVGAGIQLGPNATRILDTLGILESVRAFSAEPDALSVHDGKSGRVLARLPLGSWMRARHGAPYLTLHRQDLHRALSAAARDDTAITITAGCGVTGFQNTADGATLDLGNGTRQSAAALIAADGLWSRLRPLVVASDAPAPAGKCAYRTVVPVDAVPTGLTRNDVHIWLAPGAHVVHYPVRQGREIAIVVVIDGSASHEGWNSAASLDTLAASPVAVFSEQVRALIFASAAWRMWPLQKIAPLPRWSTGVVTLLGDAAHPLLPFFAQGGGLALEDAAVLAKHIAAHDRPMAARLAAYEAARRPRAMRVVDASAANGRIYHLHGAVAAARNAVLSSVPPALLMRRYDWLYGWTP